MSIDCRALSTIAFFPEGAYGPTDDCAGKPMELLLADTASPGGSR